MKKSYIHIHLVLDAKQTDKLIQMVHKTGKVGLSVTLGAAGDDMEELSSLKRLYRRTPNDNWAKSMLKQRIQELEKKPKKRKRGEVFEEPRAGRGDGE